MFKRKRTVVFVTNNIEEAIYLADRIYLTPSPATVKAEYDVKFLAHEIIQALNFLN